jgi:hypothetical protein
MAIQAYDIRDDLDEPAGAVIADVCRILRGYGFLHCVGQRTYSAEMVREILGDD